MNDAESTVAPLAQSPAVIVFEGIDGAGKTTQIGLLDRALRDRGFSVVTTGVFCTLHGREVRAWFMDEGRISRMSLRTQLFLLGSAMNQIVEDIAASDASVFLVDRFVYTTAAYHGGGLEMGIAAVEEVYAPILRRCPPDLVVLLDLPTDLVPLRKTATDRVEEESRAFYERVGAAYASIASALPCAVRIDARQPEADIHAQLLPLVLERMHRRQPRQESGCH
jgi:dTMP kinase